MADAHRKPVLSYEPPGLSEAEDDFPWLRRRLDAFEVAVVGWPALCLLYMLVATVGFDVRVVRPLLGLCLTLPLVFVVSVAVLIWQHRWRHLRLVLVMVLVSLPWTGVVQFDSCPHARYLQVFGITYTLSGKACGNARSTAPWWVR